MSNFAKKVGLWNLRMVQNALEKGRITQVEYDEIVNA